MDYLALQWRGQIELPSRLLDVFDWEETNVHTPGRQRRKLIEIARRGFMCRDDVHFIRSETLFKVLWSAERFQELELLLQEVIELDDTVFVEASTRRQVEWISQLSGEYDVYVTLDHAESEWLGLFTSLDHVRPDDLLKALVATNTVDTRLVQMCENARLTEVCHLPMSEEMMIELERIFSRLAMEQLWRAQIKEAPLKTVTARRTDGSWLIPVEIDVRLETGQLARLLVIQSHREENRQFLFPPPNVSIDAMRLLAHRAWFDDTVEWLITCLHQGSPRHWQALIGKTTDQVRRILERIHCTQEEAQEALVVLCVMDEPCLATVRILCGLGADPFRQYRVEDSEHMWSVAQGCKPQVMSMF